jgi:peptide deformylase
VEILTHPNPVLRQPSADVDPRNDSELPSLVSKMADSMYEAPGLGLAAAQVGVLKRVVVYDLDDGLVTLCNPVIVEASDETVTDEEGCLSFPGITLEIERPVRVVCEALDLEGKPIRVEAEGLQARLFMHEIDHTNGVLIIDRATPEERKAALKRYREANAVLG